MENKIELKYYIFDWDDNILHMDTKIIMEHFNKERWKIVNVSTSDFADVRNDKNYRIPITNGKPDYDLAFENFRDNGTKGSDKFIEDIIIAINNNKFGVSYSAFKNSLINGNILFILTARGHEQETIKRGVMYFIETQLTPYEKSIMLDNLRKYNFIFKSNLRDDELLDNYLNLCDFIGVSSNYFKEMVDIYNLSSDNNFDPTNTELSKKIATKHLVELLHKYKLNDNFTLKIGFSDDDKKNVSSVVNLFKDLSLTYKDTHFVVYDTSKNKDDSINYNKILV